MKYNKEYYYNKSSTLTSSLFGCPRKEGEDGAGRDGVGGTIGLRSCGQSPKIGNRG